MAAIQDVERSSTETTEHPPSQSAAKRKLPPTASHAEPSRIPAKLLARVKLALQEPRWPLVLWGPTGTGKTCLAALLYAHRPTTERVAWYSARVLLRELALARVSPGDSSLRVSILTNRGEPSHAEVLSAWDQIERADFLVLDDIGTRDKLSPAQSELFIDLLDARGSRPTLYTSNLDREGLSRVLDGRIVSRLFAGSAVECGGTDQRIGQGVDYRAKR